MRVEAEVQLCPLPCKVRPVQADGLALVDTRGVEAEVNGQLLGEFLELGVQRQNHVVSGRLALESDWWERVHGLASELGQPDPVYEVGHRGGH